MKHRWLLALALLLACALLCAPALAFKDDAQIGQAYREAVEAMTAQGVLEGFPDDSFRPDGTLTREQGAKIIAYLRLGKGTAEKLLCNKAPFDDVAANRWSAPYIAWCVDNDILHGYGGGRFGPGDPLTGDQYTKMLLCALGLARKGNYSDLGGDWYLAVREDAKAAKLYNGDASMETNKPITRAQAALLSQNTVVADDGGTKPSPSPAPSGGGTGGGTGGSTGGGTGGSTGGTTTPPAPGPSPKPGSGDILLPEVP